MARIRSVHPSLFTDEAWVSCSPLARLFYIGLLTDADDQGLFEWKPLQLRMRLLPGDDAHVPSLLEELVAVGLIAELESGGKKLGAIRKFRRFQRPKKPNALFVLPPEWGTYVGLDDASSELDDDERPPVPPQPTDKPPPVPKKGELGQQMEDGGRNKDSVSNETVSDEPRKADVDRLWSIASAKGRERSSRKDVGRALKAAQRRGGTLDQIALGVENYYASFDATKNGGDYAKGLHRLIENDRWTEHLGPPDIREAAFDPMLQPEDWRQRKWMEEFVEGKFAWAPQRGPEPGRPGCRVSPEIQREFGVEPAGPVSAREGRAA